ncbi:hypothetical protein [Parabacteroides sp. FAFU027]|uniref:hypothetical protein n=1 Tax=Parabacteroides sp. FAFU027 TaxID=2922715 RepID=UPI001FAFC317|nr:hypothetical protein [Parabacteroides sp. FAFU027]
MNKKTQQKIRLKDLRYLFDGANKLKMAVIFTVFAIIVYVVFVNQLDYNRLKDSGTGTKGIVFDKRIPGYRGIVNTYYRFSVKGVSYEGISDDDDKIQIGDSFDIMYLESDPQINRSLSMMK